MLLNLQSNAIKFSPRGSKIIIQYSVYNKEGKSYVEIQVKDQGCGIKLEDQSKLFKLFGFLATTEEANTRGIGLGLVISKRIVNAFDGLIGFKSKYEEGSTFVFSMQLEKNLRIATLNREILTM